MPHQLLLATRNRGKIEEFRRILDAIAPGQIELLGLDKFPELHDVVEDGETFQENALKKAREMSLATGLPAIADDSGLCVDALNGDPGIFSARWAGSLPFCRQQPPFSVLERRQCRPFLGSHHNRVTYCHSGRNRDSLT